MPCCALEFTARLCSAATGRSKSLLGRASKPISARNRCSSKLRCIPIFCSFEIRSKITLLRIVHSFGLCFARLHTTRCHKRTIYIFCYTNSAGRLWRSRPGSELNSVLLALKTQHLPTFATFGPLSLAGALESSPSGPARHRWGARNRRFGPRSASLGVRIGHWSALGRLNRLLEPTRLRWDARK